MVENVTSYLKGLEEEKETFEKIRLEKIKQYSKVIIWGLSESATVAIEYLKNHDIVIDGIYDDNESKHHSFYQGIEIQKPDFTCQDKDIIFIVTCSYYETIRKELLKYDSNIDNRLLMFDGYFLENTNYDYYYKNMNKINECYNSLEDEESKQLYILLLKYRYIRDISILQNHYQPRKETYFDKVFLSDFKEGLYIDAGSYNADFVTGLMERKDTSNCKFYIFEPNRIFSDKIKRNLENNCNFKVYQMALCDKKGELSFQQIESSTSHLVDPKYNAYNNTLDCNVELVKTDTLDNIIGEEKVTCIKVDIEGSEKSMIQGSTNIIKRDRPIILLSVYHRCSDLWNLQSYLKELNLNYKFYLRHYSLSVAKTILYCIPE